jgi:putative copper export protein
MPEGLLHDLMAADAVAIHLGLALVIGSLASQCWLWSRASGWRDRVARQALGARRFGFLLGLVGLLAALWFEAAVMTDTTLSQTGPGVVALMQGTHFGRAWLIGFVAWVAMGALSCSAKGIESRTGRFAAGLLAVAVFVVTRSVVSHAGSHGDATLDVAVDWVHLVLVCLWVGIVMAGARLAFPEHAMSRAERDDAARWVSLMSTSATMALIGIGATGAYKVWRAFEPAASISLFVGSPYGQALAVKLLLVAVAVMLGGVNRFRVLPHLFERLTSAGDERPWSRRLVAILRFEVFTLTAVLAAAAVLSSLEVPGEASTQGGMPDDRHR